MRMFGLPHLCWIAGIVIVALLLPVLVRRRILSVDATRFTLGCVLAANESIRNFYEGFQFPNDLPIQLCTVLTWTTVIACLTLVPWAVEFSYFVGLVGAGLTTLTPDVHSPAFSYASTRFFITHGGIVIAASTLVFGGAVTFRKGAALRANLWVAIYAVLIGIFDAIFHVNYMYLCRKPKGASVLDYLGPWPVYLIGAEMVALTLFWLLWLPIRPRSVPAEDLKSREAQ
jgi:hypothetical integral membrane protein (TIGR02206 family)